MEKLEKIEKIDAFAFISDIELNNEKIFCKTKDENNKKITSSGEVIELISNGTSYIEKNLKDIIYWNKIFIKNNNLLYEVSRL